MLVLYSLNPLDLTQEKGSAKYQELLRITKQRREIPQ